MIAKATVVLLLCCLRSSLCVPLSEFYPYGENIEEPNQRLANGDGSFQCVFPDQVYRFCNTPFYELCVTTDGGTSFGADPIPYTTQVFPLGGDNYLAAAYWVNIDSSVNGNVWFRQSTAPDLLTRASNDVQKAFPLLPRFTPTHLFIATWDGVGANSGIATETNTFQSILATNGDESYAVYLFADGMMQWADSNGTPARVGMTCADMKLTHPASGSQDIVNVDEDSNAGEDGKYVYCLTDLSEPIQCSSGGVLYDIGEQFQPNCNSRCTCNFEGNFDCETVPCPIDGPKCTASGDPHYTTWDGRKYNYMGDCEYYVATLCDSDDFLVSTVNDRTCGSNPGVTCVDQVRVVIPSGNPSEVLLARTSTDFQPSITINGVLQPNIGDMVVLFTPELEVVRAGGKAYVTIKTYGVRVHYDGRYTSTFQVSTSLRGMICGQCGTYNGNQNDDFTLPDGSMTTSADVFGDSWEVPRSCVKKRDADGFTGCDNSADTITEAQQRCSALTMDSFAACNAVVDPTNFIADCEFDYCCCAVDIRDECYCSSLSNYALACTAAGVQVSGWRDDFGCPADCPEGMVYQECGPICPQTCDNKDESCDGGCAAGCFCPYTQYLLDGVCVDEEVCTECDLNGTKVQEGTEIQPNCSSRCVCTKREFQCETQTCLVDGTTCIAAGDPYYQTFDFNYYEFQGDCEYVVSTPCDSDEFSISVRYSSKNAYISSADQVTVSVPGDGVTAVLGRGGGGTITVNGVLESDVSVGVIYQSDKVQVLRVGGHPQVVLLEQQITIFYDGINRVAISTSTMWQDKLCGLCGNYNGDPTDDFMDQGGNPLATADEFASSWTTGDTTTCSKLEEAPICVGHIREEATKRCSFLNGEFFQPCHAAVDPQSFEDYCVLDFCNCVDDDKNVCFCSSLSTYASACSYAGVQLDDWRSYYGCSDGCPADMTFQQCGSLCPQSCDSTDATCHSGCAEGCFCPDGQIVNQDRECGDFMPCPGQCPVLTDPDNGMVDCSLGDDGVPTEGDTCTYQCDDGYELSGDMMRECQSDGTWTGSDPTCDLVVQCPTLTAPDNGMISCTGNEVGDTCTISCDDGYELGGNETRTCQGDGTWSGTDATCSAVQCPTLTAPDNGMISCTGNEVGDTCTVSCDDGYELGGSETRTCQGDGTWSGTDATCSAVQCPTLTAPDNGMISCTGNEVGDTCTVSCDDGYELGGSETRTCQGDGTWSGTDATCSTVQCPTLTAPDNGMISCTGNEVGDTCTISCDDGYELGGNETRTCQGDGTWSGTDATCSAVQCPTLTAPDNGMISCTGNEVGDTCTISCDDGYELGGSETRTCQGDGTWSGTDATCSAVQCPPLTAPDNGMISCTGNDTGDTCTISCDDGYELGGSETRTCQGDGTWSGTDAVCAQGTACPPLSDPDGGMIDCSLGVDGVPNPGDTCTYTCDDGYMLDGDMTVTCGDDGSWSDDTTCKLIRCKVLKAPQFGSINCSLGDDGKPTPGDTCSFSCDEGYNIGDTTTTTCKDNGNWAPALSAECVLDGCEVNSVVDGSITSMDKNITVTFTSDSTDPEVFFDCRIHKKDFKICTSPLTYTEDDGVRDGENIVRLRAQCPGQINDRPTQNLAVVICCPLILGNGTVNCELGENGGPNAGDNCTLTCNPGFIMDGSDSRMCDDLGTWTGDDTTCTAPDCEITMLDANISSHDLTITVNFVADDPRALYSCKLNNRDFVDCTSPFTYASQQVRPGDNQVRVRAKCPGQSGSSEVEVLHIQICEALTLDNGMIDCQYGDNGGPNAGDMCSFTCDAGFDLSGSASRTCFENGTWSGEISMCTGSQLSDNRCPLLPDPADGSITCSLTRNDAPADGESCSITCDSGFDLSGSSSRTCQIQSGRGSWTGTGATCRGCSLTSISADHKVSRDDVTVTFSADPSHSETVFQCRLDRQRYRSCTSPMTYNNLSRGRHTVTVRGKCPGDDSLYKRTKVQFRIRRGSRN